MTGRALGLASATLVLLALTVPPAASYDGPAPNSGTVVTGAPNLFQYKGQGRLSHPLKAVFAKEGSRLYDGREPFALRGQELPREQRGHHDRREEGPQQPRRAIRSHDPRQQEQHEHDEVRERLPGEKRLRAERGHVLQAIAGTDVASPADASAEVFSTLASAQSLHELVARRRCPLASTASRPP